MNLAQVSAYLEDAPAPQPLAWWAERQPNPRLWLAPSEMKRYDVQAYRESLKAIAPRRRLGAFKRRPAKSVR